MNHTTRTLARIALAAIAGALIGAALTKTRGDRKSVV